VVRFRSLARYYAGFGMMINKRFETALCQSIHQLGSKVVVEFTQFTNAQLNPISLPFSSWNSLDCGPNPRTVLARLRESTYNFDVNTSLHFIQPCIPVTAQERARRRRLAARAQTRWLPPAGDQGRTAGKPLQPPWP
jgi:hypothetical protein